MRRVRVRPIFNWGDHVKTTTNGNSRNVRFAAVLLLALALLAAGCGTRVKEQTEATGNGGLGGDPGQSQPGGGPSGGTSPGGGPSGPTGPMFGTLPVPCGPITSGEALTATGLGVTESEIVVSTICLLYTSPSPRD